MGRMTGRFEPNGSNNYESFHYDAADNLLYATQSSSTSKLLDDLFARFKQTEYSYDEFGQLKRKRGKGNDQFFTFDDEGRLIHAQGIGANGEHIGRISLRNPPYEVSCCCISHHSNTHNLKGCA